MQIAEKKKKAMKHQWKRNMKENERKNLWRWWWVETTKISVRPPLESFILFKIRPKGRRDNTHSSSHNICAK